MLVVSSVVNSSIWHSFYLHGLHIYSLRRVQRHKFCTIPGLPSATPHYSYHVRIFDLA